MLAIIGTARPPFLILAPLCVAVAIAYAHSVSTDWEWLDALLCVVAAVLAHASVNMLNEYRDHVSKLDHETSRTPFSGGSGTLQNHPELASATLIGAWCLLAISALIGLYFVLESGTDLLVVGLGGLALVALYTPQINRFPLVCLLAPGFGFGVVIGAGSYLALSGEINWDILLLVFPVFLLVNNLLLMNQFPDVTPDKRAGRRHLIIRYGLKSGVYAYACQVVLATIASGIIIHRFELSEIGLLLLLPCVAGLICIAGLWRYSQHRKLQPLVPFMALNVLVSLSYPATLSLLLWLA